MTDDGESAFAETEELIRCPVCDLLALEWRVCSKCEQKVGIACCTTDANGETICNECKE